MGWSDDSKNARGGRGRQRAKTKEEQRIFDLNFGLRPKFFFILGYVKLCNVLGYGTVTGMFVMLLACD